MPTRNPKRKYLSRVRRVVQSSPRTNRFIDEPAFKWDVVKTMLPYIGSFVGALAITFFTVQAHGQHLSSIDDKVNVFQATKEQRIAEQSEFKTRLAQQSEEIKDMRSDIKEMRADIKTLLSRNPQ